MILDIFRYERNEITKKKIISHVDNNDRTIISPVKGQLCVRLCFVFLSQK